MKHHCVTLIWQIIAVSLLIFTASCEDDKSKSASSSSDNQLVITNWYRAGGELASPIDIYVDGVKRSGTVEYISTATITGLSDGLHDLRVEATSGYGAYFNVSVTFAVSGGTVARYYLDSSGLRDMS